MRRLPRMLLGAVTILSLLLLLAGAVLWARSYWRKDYIRWSRPARPDADAFFILLASGSGGATTGVVSLSPKIAERVKLGGWHWESSHQKPIPYAGDWAANRWGFGYESSPDPHVGYRRITFPHWVPATLFASLPATRLALLVRRRRRVREGHCPKCGYDLRATPDRCPECGAVPAAVPRAGAV